MDEPIEDAKRHRSNCYAYLRNVPFSSVSLVSRKDKTLTGNWEEIDAIVRTAWGAITAKFQSQPEPDLAKFRSRFGKYVKEYPMRLDDLTGKQLRQASRKWKARTAGGADGALVGEIQSQPDWLWEDLATVLNLIERTGRWPPAILQALGSLIPKAEDKTGPLELRPVTLMSLVYRLWGVGS